MAYRIEDINKLAKDLTDYLFKWFKKNKILNPREVSVAFNMAFFSITISLHRAYIKTRK